LQLEALLSLIDVHIMVNCINRAFALVLFFAAAHSQPDDEDDGHDEGMPGLVPLSEKQMQGIHAIFDKNGDGKATLAELMAFSSAMQHLIYQKDAPQMMQGLDSNQDGKLSLEEVLEQPRGNESPEDLAEIKSRAEHEEAKFKIADKNGDNMLDMSEIPAMYFPETDAEVLKLVVDHSMKEKDLDGDGGVSLEEFWRSMTGGIEQDDDSGMEEERPYFDSLDKDGNGLLNLEEMWAWESGTVELEEAVHALFKTADKDGDGHITVEELASAREELAQTEIHDHMLEWVEHHEL